MSRPLQTDADVGHFVLQKTGERIATDNARAEEIRGLIVVLEREVRLATPIAEGTSSMRRYGMQTWGARDKIARVNEEIANLTAELRGLGYELEAPPDETFEFDVVETRGRSGALLALHARRVQGCRHVLTGQDEFKARMQAEREHREVCLKDELNVAVRQHPR